MRIAVWGETGDFKCLTHPTQAPSPGAFLFNQTTAPVPGHKLAAISSMSCSNYLLMARRDPVGIRLLTRNGHGWAPRYPLIFP